MKLIVIFAFNKELTQSQTWGNEVSLHREYMKKHLERYNIVSGVFLDQNGGFMILEMDSKERLMDIINNNPLVKENKVEAKVHEWLEIEGKL